MSRDLSVLTLENLEDEVVYPFFAVELMFDGNNIIRMWTGQGTLVLEDGTEWIGLGTLLDISAIEETAEMAVKGATITLSGVASDVISLALSEPYQGRVCNIYFGTFSTGKILQESGAFILLQDGSKSAPSWLKMLQKKNRWLQEASKMPPGQLQIQFFA